jgi:NADH-quinone oxidoreductase subunit F
MRIESYAQLDATRKEYVSVMEAYKTHVLVCAGTGCVAGGSLEIYRRLCELTAADQSASVELLEEHAIKKSGCHGYCEIGPLVRIEPYGFLYVHVSPDDCEDIYQQTILRGEAVNRLVYTDGGKSYLKQDMIPFYHRQTRNVLKNCGTIDAESIEEYIATGGYSALQKALFELSPDEIVTSVVESGLRGRGGGGFPTGRKWAQVMSQKELKRYIVCNGDEGDPGAFMDRSIMEGDPHKIIEGMAIAAVAVKADEGYIYVRAEYPLAVARLKTAAEQAESLGLLGKNILGSGSDFTLHIYQGAGAFVCGEGSALTASIEGERGMPRVKPPRTVEQGLWAKPTVLNNVETFANVPAIITNGAAWFRSMGTASSPGTKAFALTGNVNNTGLIEVPMGTTLREIIFDIGGGVKEYKAFKAVQIGGPSGGCLTAEHLDMPLDFDSLKKCGAMIGSGGLVVMDEDTCMVEVARFFMRFTQNESCGKCVPCREGTRRMLEILDRIVAGDGCLDDLDMLEELADTITHTALCGLGKSAALPVVSTLKYFRGEYLAHVVDKRCPTGTCQKLKRLVINSEICRGCTKCAKVCPANAISGEAKKPFAIDGNKCIRCMACIPACPFMAIKES